METPGRPQVNPFPPLLDVSRAWMTVMIRSTEYQAAASDRPELMILDTLTRELAVETTVAAQQRGITLNTKLIRAAQDPEAEGDNLQQLIQELAVAIHGRQLCADIRNDAGPRFGAAQHELLAVSAEVLGARWSHRRSLEDLVRQISSDDELRESARNELITEHYLDCLDRINLSMSDRMAVKDPTRLLTSIRLTADAFLIGKYRELWRERDRERGIVRRKRPDEQDADRTPDEGRTDEGRTDEGRTTRREQLPRAARRGMRRPTEDDEDADLDEAAMDAFSEANLTSDNMMQPEPAALNRMTTEQQIEELLRAYMAASRQNRIGFLLHLFEGRVWPSPLTTGVVPRQSRNPNKEKDNQYIADVLQAMRADPRILAVYLTDDDFGIGLSVLVATQVMSVLIPALDELEEITVVTVRDLQFRFRMAIRPYCLENFEGLFGFPPPVADKEQPEDEGKDEKPPEDEGTTGTEPA